MGVLFDNAASVSGTAVTSLTTPSFTVTQQPERAAALQLCLVTNPISAITGSLGGVSGSAIAGTDSEAAFTRRTLMFGVTAFPSGLQTATMSWTTAVNAAFGVVTAYRVDQTVPFINGTFTGIDASVFLHGLIVSNGLEGVTHQWNTSSSSSDAMSGAAFKASQGMNMTTGSIAVGQPLNTPKQHQRWEVLAGSIRGAGSTGLVVPVTYVSPGRHQGVFAAPVGMAAESILLALQAVEVFDPAFMAAMNRPWRDIVFQQPETVASGMTPSDLVNQ